MPMGMNTRNLTWRRTGCVLWSIVIVVVIISEVERFADASAEGFSARDWVSAVALAGLFFCIGSLVVLRVRERRIVANEQRSVDFDRVRVVRERDGRVPAVRELRRQDPALSLAEANRTVDAL